MFACRFADFCKIRSSNHPKTFGFKKKFKQNEFCIEELGHFENRSIKKLLNHQNVWKHKQFTIGFSIHVVKYPYFYEFRRFISIF